MRTRSFAQFRLRDARRLGNAAAAALPLACALFGAAPFGHLGDAPAFAARALEHPSTPAELLARAFSLVPLGSLSLRMSLSAAVWLGLLAMFTYRAIGVVLRAQGVLSAPLRAAFAVGLCWLALAPVYAHGVMPGENVCTAALTMFVLYELSLLWLAPKRSRAWLCIGLGLLLAGDASAFVLLVPALVAAGVGAPARITRRWLAPAAAAAVAGLALQVRGASASAFGPSFAVASALIETSPLLGVSALLGAIAIARNRSDDRASVLRRVGWIWTLAWIGWLVFGAQASALCQLLPIGAVLSAALIAALAAPAGMQTELPSIRQKLAAGVLCGLGVWQLGAAAHTADAAEFTLPEAWAAATLDGAPARALVLAHDPLLGQLACAARAETHVRPDLRIVDMGALERPDYARSLAQATNLRPLVRSYLLQGALSRSELESLSAERPVLLDRAASPELFAALRPVRLWYEVAGSRVTKSELHEATAQYDVQLENLARAAEPSASTPAGRSFLERTRLGFSAPALP